MAICVQTKLITHCCWGQKRKKLCSIHL